MDSPDTGPAEWREMVDTIELRIIESELMRLGVSGGAPTADQFNRAFEAALPRLRRYDSYWYAKTEWPARANADPRP